MLGGGGGGEVLGEASVWEASVGGASACMEGDQGSC